jgi:hypothetical protein
MFDFPLEWCPIRNNWVALDETFAECAHPYGCRPDRCGLAALRKGWQSAARATAAASRESGLEVS